MLDQETRRKIMLHQEGLVLASVSNYGVDTACESARCLIDGVANALIRLEGHEETAHFIFALSDRVAGGLADNTKYLSPVLLDPLHAKFDDKLEHPDVPAEPALRHFEFHIGPQFSWGFMCGLAVMMLITILAQGRV